jgi:hypothetical protein
MVRGILLHAKIKKDLAANNMIAVAFEFSGSIRIIETRQYAALYFSCKAKEGINAGRGVLEF